MKKTDAEYKNQIVELVNENKELKKENSKLKNENEKLKEKCEDKPKRELTDDEIKSRKEKMALLHAKKQEKKTEIEDLRKLNIELQKKLTLSFD